MQPICHHIRGVAWSRDGRWFAKFDDDGNTDVHDHGTIAWQIEGEESLFYGMSLRANRLRCWISRQGDRLLAIDHEGALVEARRDGEGKGRWTATTGTKGCHGALAVSEDETAVAHALIVPPRFETEHDSIVKLYIADREPIETSLGRSVELLALELRGGSLTIVLGDKEFPPTIRVERFSEDLRTRETLGTFLANPRLRVAAFQPDGAIAFLGVRGGENHTELANVVGIASASAEILWSRDFAPFHKNDFIFSSTNTDLAVVGGQLVVGHEKHYLGNYAARIHVWSRDDESDTPKHELLLPGCEHLALDPRGERAVIGAARRSRSRLIAVPGGDVVQALGVERKRPNLTLPSEGPLLGTLERVEWASLGHAYGSAGDVPDLLRELALSDTGRREGAWHALYGNIYHQGSLYEATPWAVPFFLELLASDEAQGKADIVRYLRALTQACGWALARADDASSDESPEFAADVIEGLRAGAPIYARLLADPDEGTRAQALALTGALGLEHDPTKTLEAFASLEEETHRAIVALCLGKPILADAAAPSDSSLVRMALAFAQIGRAPASATAAGVIAAALRDEPEVFETLRWICEEEPIEGLDQRLDRIDDAGFAVLFEPLCDMLEHAETDDVLETFGRLLIERVFPTPVEGEEFDEKQRRVLVLLAKNDLPFEILDALEKVGFGDITSREDLFELLGMPPEAHAPATAPSQSTPSRGEAVAFGELDEAQRSMVAAFVDHLDARAWKEARQWYDFARRAPDMGVHPIAHGRYYGSQAVLELVLSFFDPHALETTGERVGAPFVRLTIVPRDVREAIVLRAYVTSDNLVSVLDAVTSQQDGITHDSFAGDLVRPLIALGVSVALELGDGELAMLAHDEAGG